MACMPYVSGKCLFTADAALWVPFRGDKTQTGEELLENIKHIENIMDNLPSIAAYLEELRVQLQRDGVCVCVPVMQLRLEGWPGYNVKEHLIRPSLAEPAK